MDAADLRAAQAPLKRRYREDSASARTALSARATLVSSSVTVDVVTAAGPVRAGLHRATGGDGSDACSGDMLLEALVACVGVTLQSVALASGIRIEAGSLTATSSFDARGTLAVSRDAPVGVGPVEVVAELETDADDDRLQRLAELTERYCVVGQSLAHPPRVVVRRVRAST